MMDHSSQTQFRTKRDAPFFLRRIFSKSGLLTILVLLAAISLLISRLHAAEEPGTDQFSRQFDEVKAKLENIEQKQKEIQEKDDKILEELDRIRVWSRRR